MLEFLLSYGVVGPNSEVVHRTNKMMARFIKILSVTNLLQYDDTQLITILLMLTFIYLFIYLLTLKLTDYVYSSRPTFVQCSDTLSDHG